jgi:hypothetical protein
MGLEGVVVLQTYDVCPVLDLEHDFVVADGQPAAEIERCTIAIAFQVKRDFLLVGGACEGFAPVGADEQSSCARHAGEQVAVHHAGSPFIFVQRHWEDFGAATLALLHFYRDCAVFAGELWRVRVGCASNASDPKAGGE